MDFENKNFKKWRSKKLIQRVDNFSCIKYQINICLNSIMEVNPEYNFYANEGESFLEMEDRQINWQLQQDIAEAEMIITHLDQKGNEYGIDLDESSVGGPLPPPGFLDDDEDDGIDIRELLYNPDDPNDRSIRGTPPPSQIST